MTDIMTNETNEENETLAADIAEGAGEAGASEGDEAAARIAALEAELATAKQETLYAMADTQNVRRRMEKELADTRSYAATAFSRDVLSVADNLTRALEAIPAELREDERIKSLITGLDATAKELESVFRKHGVEKFVAIGETLDPNRHQAMVEIPSNDAAPGTIIHEMQAGYMIKDRLLRPALVGVAKAPE
jgi:molecular chaperone GrpE